MTTRVYIFRVLAVLGMAIGIVATLFVIQLNTESKTAINLMYIRLRDKSTDSAGMSYWSDKVLYPSALEATIAEANSKTAVIGAGVTCGWVISCLLMAWRNQVAVDVAKRHAELVQITRRVQ